MKESRYGYAVARTRSLENSLLEKNKLEKLLAAPSLEEALSQLADTVYADAVAKPDRPEDFERALSEKLIEEYQYMAELGMAGELVTLRWRYDLVNLKLAIRARLSGEEPRGFSPLGTIPPEQLMNLESLPAPWGEAPLEGERDPQKLDFILDKTFYRAALENSADPYLKGWWQLEVDLRNLGTFLRLSALGIKDRSLWDEARIPGGELEEIFAELSPPDLEALKTSLSMTKFAGLAEEGVRSLEAVGSLGNFERLADNMQVEYFSSAKYIPFGPEPLIAYILGRENEVKILRIILAGKANNLSREEIRERLREVYG